MKVNNHSLLILFSLISVTAFVACSSLDSGSLPKYNIVPENEYYKAELPELKKGDSWDEKVSSQGSLERNIVTVVNENKSNAKEFYTVTSLAYFKNMDTPIKVYGEIDKKTLEITKMEMAMELNGVTLTNSTTFEFSYTLHRYNV